MGEVGAEAMQEEEMEVQVCPAMETGHGTVDEKEEAVTAAVAVVGASARRGVVALCASVAHIIRKNLRLQQQVKELEGRLKALERLTGIPGDSSATSQCQEYSSVTSQCQEYSSAVSHCPSTSDSLPESPSSQRCGSAPPHFPAGFLRPYRGPGSALRKASDPESGAAFLRGHTRASTGNLSRCGPAAASSFVRRKYSSISLRRVRRATLNAARLGRAGTASSEQSSTTSLEQQDSNSNSSSSKSCVITTVAEVYPAPASIIINNNNNNNNNTEGDAVKLLAQKLTNVLQDDSTQHQDNTEDMVLCAPHPLAGCECILCLQLAADPDILPYEIITDEGLLLPRGSTVLVRGRRVGTVVYFGHRKHQVRGTSTPQAPLLPPSAPGTCETPADGCVRSLASPLGVMVQLWQTDEGEMFVPLNDVICQLDEEGSPSSLEELSTPVLEEGSNTTSRCNEESTPTEARGNSTGLDHTLTDPHDSMTGKECMVQDPGYGVLESRGHPRDRHCSSVSNSSSLYDSLECGHEATQAVRGGRTTSTKGRTAVTASNTEVALKRTKVTGTDHSFPDSPKRNRRLDGRYLDCEDDLEAHYLECEKGKLQFGDTWDSGCYMSLGRHSSECSEQFSDLDSEYGSSGQPWASSLEEALNSVWKKHKHQNTLSPYIRRPPPDTLVLDTEIELQDYRFHKKVREDTVC